MEPKKIPFALPPLFSSRLHKDPASVLSAELWFIFKDSELLIDKGSKQPFQLTKDIPLERSIYMGTYQDQHVYAGENPVCKEISPEAIWVNLRTLYGHIDESLLALAGRASQLIQWDRSHQFCGQCGSKTVLRANEQAKECLSCKLLAFPKICPAIMALIIKEDEILLARGDHFPPNVYSVLAGFVDCGESLEQCVAREVFEEVGLQIDNIEYFGSQSWPFPHSLMIAFTCRWVSGEIKIDPAEIADARWFKKETIPFLPSEMSIARVMIDSVFLMHKV